MQTITPVKSPFNYTGNKYKLLPQTLPLFPPNIGTFIDLFGGGGDISANVIANKIMYNDILAPLVEVLIHFKLGTIEDIDERFREILRNYRLNIPNINGYYNLREDYNYKSSWDKFFILVMHSFNRHIRFNNKGEFNEAFGHRGYNANIKQNLYEFVNRLHSINIEFQCNDFRNIKVGTIYNNDFIYCDPPYSISDSDYTRYWSSKDDSDLLELLDCLNKLKIKFALSNVFENKGLTNEKLIKWSNNYNIHYLDYNYANCSYNRTKRNTKTVEVLITNY